MADIDLRGNSELFDLLVKNVIGLAIFTLDAQGRVATWNESSERLLRYQSQEIIGQTFAVFFTPEDRANNEPEKELATAAEVGQASDDRWTLRKDQSRFWVSGLTIALKDGTLRGFAKVMRDQTVMKQALDEVTHLNGKLQTTLGTLTQAQEKLYDKVLDLEKFEEVVVGRELEMIKIKRELENTKKELAQLKQNGPGQTLPR